jgi:hypothetical protein
MEPDQDLPQTERPFTNGARGDVRQDTASARERSVLLEVVVERPAGDVGAEPEADFPGGAPGSPRAPARQLCAEGYSGWLGVGRRGNQFGSAVVRPLPSVLPAAIAVTGRQNA